MLRRNMDYFSDQGGDMRMAESHLPIRPTSALGTSRLRKRPLRPVPEVRLHGPCSVQRPLVERYIAEVFRASYSASLAEFLPYLVSVACRDQPYAAIGLRTARDTALFLEQYLNSPVEDAIASRTGTPVERSEIIELGNLVSTRRGSSHLLFLLLAATLHQAGVKWAAFTGTRQVEKIIRKLGFEIHPLGKADPAGLGEKASDWGSYYAAEPVVFAGKVADAMVKANERSQARAIMAVYRTQTAALADALRAAGIT